MIHTLLQIHVQLYIEVRLNCPKYGSIWSSHIRMFMTYESFFTEQYVLSNICLVYIKNNCFVSKRGLSQAKKRAHYISDIQVTLSFAMISSMIIERDYRIDIPIYSVTSKSTTGTQVPNSFVCVQMCHYL